MTNFFLYKRFFKAVLLTGCFFVGACENDIRQVEALGKKTTAVEEALDVVSYYSQGAVVKAKLTAPLMLRIQSDTPAYEFPKSLHVDFYNDSTSIESQLFAKYGRYMENQNKVLLQDSVIVFNIKGDTLRTNELWWDQNKGNFYTDKPVSIHKSHSDVIDAIGMTASQDLNDVNLFKIQPSTYLHVADSTLPQ